MRLANLGLAAAVIGVVASVTACATPDGELLDATSRAAQLTTTGCGHASGRTGSGVAVGDGFVVTVAHLVAQASEVRVTVGGVDRGAGTIVGLDTRLDLAAIRLDEASHQPVGTTRAAKGARGHIVDGSVSGTVPFEVNDIVEVSIEEVLGTQRYKRIGYEVDAATARGDSGAGAYNEEGRLIGVVFAFSTEPQVTWLTSSEELMRFLDIVRDKEQTWQCDSDRSRLAVAEP